MWVKVAKLEDFSGQKVQLIDHKGRQIALIRGAGKFYAIDNVCPHKGGPLAEGNIEDVRVTCPWHAWTFDLETGRCSSVPAASVKTYAVRSEDDWLCADLP